MGLKINFKCNTFVKSLFMSKKVVGIAMGGHSSEREISLESGNSVYQALRQSQWNCYRIVVDRNDWYILDPQENLYPLDAKNFTFKMNEKIIHFDVVFNAIHGTPGEDGRLAEILEQHGIPHTSCSRKIAYLTFNKRDCLEKVKECGTPVANSFIFDQGDPLVVDAIEKKVGLPCFVKPNRSGSSYGIVKVYEKIALNEAINIALKEDTQLIIETALVGMEITVGAYLLDGEVVVLPITEIISENDFFDYDAKYNGKSQEITPARLDDTTLRKVHATVKKLYLQLGLQGICRSEFIIVKGIPHLLEVNTIPGLTSASIIPQQLTAAGIELREFFESLLLEAMKNY
jgi:D-alanine-D-alanine ligase